jgi:hypothetical protein
MIGCELEIFERSLIEINKLKIADVTNCNKKVTIKNRRMYREQIIKNNTRLRVKRHREKSASNGNVTPPSPSPSSTSPIIYTKEFEKFWSIYPNKTGKGYAFECYKRAKKRKLPHIDDLIKIIEKHKLSKKWKKDEGEFIQNPSTWLNQNCWQDEVKIQNADNKKYKDYDQIMKEKGMA